MSVGHVMMHEHACKSVDRIVCHIGTHTAGVKTQVNSHTR